MIQQLVLANFLSGDSSRHNSASMDDAIQEERTAAADEDGKDQDWCDENPSSAHGGGQSRLSFAGSVLMSAARAARKKLNPPHSLSRSQLFRRRQAVRDREKGSVAHGMAKFLGRLQQQEQEEEDESPFSLSIQLQVITDAG